MNEKGSEDSNLHLLNILFMQDCDNKKINNFVSTYIFDLQHTQLFGV